MSEIFIRFCSAHDGRTAWNENNPIGFILKRVNVVA